ncbi:MAG: transposase [Bacteroidetes bacterium]|nr:transposase [Bacteroidota bacterium]
MHKYRQWLHENNMQITNKLRQLLYQKNWVIYLKQPFGAEQVVEYLGRYSH